ncbi:MAG: cohesin domain-containing protein [Candidatus Paceibacterota bacterium]
MLKTKYKIITTSVLAIAAVFIFSTHVLAATLSISPASGSYTVGKTFTARVLVGSGGQSINAVSGDVSFSSDTLTLTGISKSGVVTLWAQNPTYSNASGTASFQGVILNGYSGSGGTVVTLTFKAKAAGTATISIAQGSSSVLLNDGQGTNVLSGTSGASFTIGQGTTTSPVEPITTTKPVTPVVEIPATSVPVIVPVASSDAPLFTDYESPLRPGNFVVVKGTAAANSLITLTFTHTQHDGTTTVAQTPILTTPTGAFTFVSDEKAVQGSTYTVVATTTDHQSTEPLHLKVKNSIRFSIGMLITAIIALKISLLAALGLILLVTGYLLYRNNLLKKELRNALLETREPRRKTAKNTVDL